MYQYVLKITSLLLILLGGITSLSMAIIDEPKDEPKFDIQRLSKDLQRCIFVVAHPSIQNQLKNCSKSWHEIGVKQAPNMYELVNNSSFRASHDDWCYIMMHAALDKNIKVMRTILNRTEQRNFDYDFGINYLGSHTHKQSLRLWDVYDLNALCSNMTCEKCKELDLVSNADKCKIHFDTSLFKACFGGDIDTVEKLKADSSTGLFYDCIVIALYNDNPYCIAMLSSEVNHVVHDRLHLSLLRLAMCHNKKRAFKALVENNIYGRLNDPTGMHMGRNTTMLDELHEQTDISNLQEYIELYKKLGGKTWQEVQCEQEGDKDYLASATFCPIQ